MRYLIIILLGLFISGCATIQSKPDVEVKQSIKKENIKKPRPKPSPKLEIIEPDDAEEEAPSSDFKIILWNPVTNAKLSSPFGHRGKEFHRGIDISAPIGTTIRAASDGTVTAAGRHKFLYGYGNTILLSHGKDIFTYYAHLESIYVKKGQNVERGQRIGTVGTSGKSTGPHLHFELIINKKLHNPVLFIKKKPIQRRFIEFAQTVNVGTGLKQLMYIFK
jgi:murein DD-endopeptidase MepM/ murein hydrolase activator NlpD